MAESGHTVVEKKRSAPAAERPPTLDTSELAPTVEAAEAGRATPGADLATRHATLLGDPQLISRFSQRQRAQLVHQLQRGYGNGQVARVIAQSRPVAAGSAARITSSPAPIVATPQPTAETSETSDVATEPVLQRKQVAASPPPPTSRPIIQRSMLDSLLEKAAGWAQEIPGYYLLTVILGKDPIDDKPVERNAVNFIRGVISLVPGGDAIFKNLQESGAIDQAFQWLQDETGKLGLTWDAIKGALKQLWDSISLTDALVHPEDTWDKAKGIILPYIGKVKQFALDAGKKLFEFVLEGALKMAGPLAGTIMAAIKKAGDVIDTIAKDPVGFLSNLLKAVKGGFQQFLDNIETHLKKGLVSWLFGSLADAGIKLPTSFDLKGILTLVLEILGLSWQNIRGKLVAAIGEPAVAAVEKTVSLVKTLVTEGIGAAWQQIVQWVTEAAGDLKDMVLGAIKDFVITSVVKTAVTKLVAMFNPVGAVVQAIITIYNTVEFVVDKAKQIADLANAVLDSIASIAAGNISAAASFVEQTLGKAVPVLLGFLADLIGLGGITSKIKEIIDKVRQPIDKALNKLVGWITDKAKTGIAWLKQKGQQAVGAVKQTLGIGSDDSEKVTAKVRKETDALAKRQFESVEAFDQALKEIYARYQPQGLKSLSVAQVEEDPEKPFAIMAEASPAIPVTMVKWKDLFLPGEEPAGGAEKFAKAGDSTFALLVVDGRAATKITRSSPEGHAEERILADDGWASALKSAREDAESSEPSNTTITLTINRTPCHGEQGCSGKLTRALLAYWPTFKNQEARKRVNFYLVATGVYETKGSLANRADKGPTTDKDLEALAGAGWHLQGLQAGPEPTSRGKILSEFVQNLLKKLKTVKESG
jgi:hypothetical protein